MSKIEQPSPSSIQPSDQMTEAKDTTLQARTKSETVPELSHTSLTERTSAQTTKETTSPQQLFDALERDDMLEFERIVESSDPKTIAKTSNAEGQTISHLAVLAGNAKALIILNNANRGNVWDIKNLKGERVGDYIKQKGKNFRNQIIEMDKKNDQANQQKNIKGLFKALENDDQELFDFLIKKVSTQQIGAARNETGQTLPHLAIEKHNAAAFFQLRELNESPLGGISNAQGETVNDYIQKQDPAFKAELQKEMLVHSKKLGLAQRLILDKAAKFLKIRAEDMRKQELQENDPRLKHIEELELTIHIMLEKGHCHGFAVAWVEMFVLGLEDQYYKDLALLRDWDATKESITPELTNMMDTLFQRILFYHHESVSHITRGSWNDPFLPSTQGDLLSKYLDNPNFMFPILQLKIETKFISTAILSLLLKEGNAIMIGGGGHSIAIGQKNDFYYLFDSNYKGDEENVNLERGGRKFDSLDDLSKNIRHQLYESLGNPLTYISYSLNVVDLKKANHLYPRQKEIEDAAKIEELEEDKLLNHFDKINKFIIHQVENFPYIEQLISSMSKDQINDNSRGMTILAQFISSNTPVKKEVIKLILDKDGELTLGEYSSLYWAISGENEPDVIRMIYEKNPQQAESLPPEFKEKLKEALENQQI